MTPDRLAVAFYESVVRGEWESAYDLTQHSWRVGFSKRANVGPVGHFIQRVFPFLAAKPVRGPDDVRRLLEPYRLLTVVGYTRPIFISEVFAKVRVKVRRKIDRPEGRVVLVTTAFECMVIRESRPLTVSEDGEWGVNPVSATKRTATVGPNWKRV